MDEASAYVTLGIDETTSPDEARLIYRRRLRLLHPDLHRTHDPQLQLEAERATRQLASAWQTLQERWSIDADRAVSSMAGAGRAARSAGPAGPDRPPPTPPGADECSECGGGPIQRGRLRTVWHGRVQIVNERCCRRCGLNAFRDAQATTLTVGWLSPTGPARTVRAMAGNLRTWWRFRKLGDVRPPLRPVTTTVVAPAEMVRPVLRRPIPALLTSIVAVVLVGLATWGGVALAGSASGSGSGADPAPGRSVPGVRPSTSAPAPSPAKSSPVAGAANGSVPVVDPAALPGCTSHCRIARSLRVTVAGQPAHVLLVSTAAGRPLRALRFYLLLDSGHTVLWSGPEEPMNAYVSKRLGDYRGSVLRQDATGHVFIDLLTSANESFIVVLDFGDGRDVRDFGSMEPDAAGHFRFSTSSPGADTVDVDGAHIFDIAMPRPSVAEPYYDLYRWDGTDYVPRGCARTLMDGGLGPIQPVGTCI